MIEFKQIPQMMKQLNTPFIRVLDSDDQLIFSITKCKLVNDTIKKLEEFEPTMKGYKYVTIVAATEMQHKARFNGAYKWEVCMTSTAEVIEKKGETSSASKREYELQLEIEKMKMEKRLEDKLSALEEKLEKKTNKSFDVQQWIPLAGKFLGWTPTDVQEAMGLFKGEQQKQLAGTGTQTQLSVQMTKEEEDQKQLLIRKLNDEFFKEANYDGMIKVLQNVNAVLKNVPVDKVCAMMDYLAKNPQNVDTIMNFMK